MIRNLLFICVSFGCVPASKIQIKGNKFHGKNTHISEDIAGNFGNIKNFFTAIREDPDACNYYAPNQARCKRVFVNIEALKTNPLWMKIDLENIMTELEGKKAQYILGQWPSPSVVTFPISYLSCKLIRFLLSSFVVKSVSEICRQISWPVSS